MALTNSCHNCIFAGEMKLHPRTGEQVRCGYAQEHFGGEGWVDIKSHKVTGQPLKAKCGVFQPIQPDNAVKPPEPLVKCEKCKGAGVREVHLLHGKETIQCKTCKGRGEL